MDGVEIGDAGQPVVQAIGELLDLAERIGDRLEAAGGRFVSVCDGAAVGVVLGGKPPLDVIGPRGDVGLGIMLIQEVGGAVQRELYQEIQSIIPSIYP